MSLSLIIYFVLFSLLSWLKPKLALFFILALLPSYLIRFKISFIPFTFLEVMILILFIVWFLKFKIYKLSNIQHLISDLRIWFWLICLWLLAATIGVFVSPNIILSLGHWKAYFLEPILFFILLVNLIENKKDRNLVFYSLSFSAFYLSLVAIFQKIVGIGYESLEAWPDVKIIRATSLFPHPNFLGLYLAPLVILFLGQLIWKVENWKLEIGNLLVVGWWLLVAVLSILAIVFAQSEGALLGIFFGLVFLGLLIKRFRKITLIILIILITVITITPRFKNYFYQKITFQDLSGQIRLKIWNETLEMLKNNPIFGAGLRGYEKGIKPYHQIHLSKDLPLIVEIPPYPHNLFLAIWSELGLLGLITFLIIIFQFFKFGFRKLFRNWKLEIRNSKLERNKKILIITILSPMVTILIHGMVDTPYFKNDLALIFWFVIGLLIITKNIKED